MAREAFLELNKNHMDIISVVIDIIRWKRKAANG